MITEIYPYDYAIVSTSKLVQGIKACSKILTEDCHKRMHTFFDRTLYIVLNHMDLLTGLKYLSLSISLKNKIEANFFSRVVILTSHEILNDLHKMAGKDLANLLNEITDTAQLTEFNTSFDKMKIIRRKHLSLLKNLRNKVIGHKLEFGFQQAETIVDINTNQILKIGKEILETQMQVIQSFQVCLTNLTRKK